MEKLILNVNGMGCMKCVAKVEAAVKGVAGVTGVTANCDKSQVLVDYGDESQEAAINAAISSCGVDVLG